MKLRVVTNEIRWQRVPKMSRGITEGTIREFKLGGEKLKGETEMSEFYQLV